MGVFVFLPLVLPLTAVPVARLAEQHLHPRLATRLLTALTVVLAVCSTLCLGLLVVVGTAQLPGNPLPDGWSDAEVRDAVPYDEVAGKAAIAALVAVAAACAATGWRHLRVRRRAWSALAGMPERQLVVLPDQAPYAYALPGGGRGRDGKRAGRIVVSSALLDCLNSRERAALFAHERAHLTRRHHRGLLAVRLAARANPLLRPLQAAVAYTTERWADEEAARTTGSRTLVARAIGKAALVSRGAPAPTLAGIAGAGPVPRRVAALLAPAPAAMTWPPVFTGAGLAIWTATAGTVGSALSSANATVTLFFVLKASTQL
ncbi:heat shock protein HtpX [Streptomyces sp. S4.7]|uniref:M56 family metallopeptidase n=1 Tax=Streptomyces sp. S4.7 TaxID=2705439 RepID=UPI0013983F27|nr:M56 family metallopeptidase [Streptomyces sp. S4.7]QHY97050.1 heat shock protein HtpX [Streptomyces sp. S4.7]